MVKSAVERYIGPVARPVDAFPVVPVTLASGVGLALGVALVAWLGVRPAERGSHGAADDEAAPGGDETAPGGEETAPAGGRAAPGRGETAPGGGEQRNDGELPAPGGDEAAAAGDGAPAPREAAPAAPPGPPLGPQASGDVTVTPGRVAYLRCDGIPQRSGPSPCPRDVALETAVWAVVQTLPRCADPPRELGQSDLRLDLVPDVPTDVHARDVRGAPALDSHKLLACIAGPLSHVRTTLGTTRLVVSFRFSTAGD